MKITKQGDIYQLFTLYVFHPYVLINYNVFVCPYQSLQVFLNDEREKSHSYISLFFIQKNKKDEIHS